MRGDAFLSIVHFRVDDRLIHGQIGIAWTKVIHTDHILLANDKAAKDIMLQSIQKLTAPPNIKLSIMEVDSAIEHLNDPKTISSNERIFILVNTAVDALKLIENGVKVDSLNIGNMGFKEGAMKLTKRLFVSSEDLESLRRLSDMGIKIYEKVLPDDNETDLRPVIKNI
jgi:PTS system mannose-specific IIB component